MAPKRSHISVSPEAEGAHKLSQNSTLAVPQAQPQPQEKQLMSLGLPTLDPTKRTSPPRFGEFLQACRWCRGKFVDNDDIYMYGFLGAFCSPECREKLIKVDRYFEEHHSKSSSADRGTKRIKER